MIHSTGTNTMPDGKNEEKTAPVDEMKVPFPPPDLMLRYSLLDFAEFIETFFNRIDIFDNAADNRSAAYKVNNLFEEAPHRFFTLEEIYDLWKKDNNFYKMVIENLEKNI